MESSLELWLEAQPERAATTKRPARRRRTLAMAAPSQGWAKRFGPPGAFLSLSGRRRVKMRRLVAEAPPLQVAADVVPGEQAGHPRQRGACGRLAVGAQAEVGAADGHVGQVGRLLL